MTSKWRLLRLGSLPPIDSQIIYHAIAQAMAENSDIPNTLVICWPEKPLVCCGYHQVIEEEIDLKYCRQNNIPVVQRILGGGAVYLDDGQVFYQFMTHTGTNRIPLQVAPYYEFLLEPVVQTYREIGVKVNYAPVNDIITSAQQKISGNGAGAIGNVQILTGNIIFDFNFEEMARILKVPNEKFRDKFQKTLEERLSTLKRELSSLPNREHVIDILCKNIKNYLNIEFIDLPLTIHEKQLMKELRVLYQSSEWLNRDEWDKIAQKRGTKVAGNIHIKQSIYKAPGGLIRLIAEVDYEQKLIRTISISGDFTILPRDSPQKLEQKLNMTPMNKEEVSSRIHAFYDEYSPDSPGVTPEDWIQAITLLSTN
ncbi:MAG: biotin/lipoate A/B protein ligase family protein [Promethearchaeota archaeon]